MLCVVLTIATRKKPYTVIPVSQLTLLKGLLWHEMECFLTYCPVMKEPWGYWGNDFIDRLKD